MIWRKKEESKEGARNQVLPAYCKVAKQRMGELGRFGLRFAPDIYSFTSVEQLEAKQKAAEEARL
jgi:replicative DNA helicase